MPVHALLNIAVRAARNAGEIIVRSMNRLESLQVASKGRNDFVTEVDKASEAWGVKVLRYEIKNITPPADIIAAMEKQMRAEREKRAVILTSEGERDAAINTAEGKKQQVIKQSEATRQLQINEAEGEASAILARATATAEGIRKVADAIGKKM